jgi:UDP-glucose 4-epimerase
MSSAKPLAVVTGGAGFIGSHMVDLFLEEGFRVNVVDNLVGGRLQNLEHQKGNADLRVDTRDLREIKPGDAVFAGARYVVHFAGIGDIVPSIDRPVDYMSANVLGTVCALESARAAKVEKFVYAASSSCYGLAQELPTTENASINCEYPYALSKYQGEQAVLHWGRVYRLPVNVIRIFNAYGTRSKTTGAYGAVFGVFLAQKLKGKPLTVVGDGTQRRDFLYVTDVARAFYLAAISKVSGEIFNLGRASPRRSTDLWSSWAASAWTFPRGRANLSARGRTSPRSSGCWDGPRRSPSRRASPGCSLSSTTGGRPRSGIPSRSRRPRRTGLIS